ncbi:MAG TPA: four helix bundle protein [Pyrinomonadaceae bacterium]|jgi:four helix bundle protein
MRDFRQVKVWEKSHRLTVQVYLVTRKFPKEELFGLTSQIRRSCASIPANIAEGCGRGGNKEYAHFLQIAMGSANELDYHFLLARDVGYIDSNAYQDMNNQISEIKRMLASLHQKVKTTS